MFECVECGEVWDDGDRGDLAAGSVCRHCAPIPRTGTITDIEWTQGSGLCVLVIDGVRVPAEAGPTFRALHELEGRDVVYTTDDNGMLLTVGPQEDCHGVF